MKIERQLYVSQLLGLYLFVCLGCGSPANMPANGPQADTPSAAVEIPTASSAQSPTNAVQREPYDESQPTVSSSTASTTRVSPASVSQNANDPDERLADKPTAEQLARWKYRAFEPMQLLAYRENEKVGFVSFIAATNDSKQYLLGGSQLTLWTLASTEPVHVFINASAVDSEHLMSFAVSPVGDWCAVGNASGQLRTFDIKERKESASQMTGMRDIAHLAISPDGKEIAMAASRSEQVTIWNAATLEKEHSFKVDGRNVEHLQYTAPNTLIARSETLSTWNTLSGNKMKAYPTGKSETSVAVSAGGHELVFGTDESLQRWNLVEDRACGEYRGVPFKYSAICFTSDDSLVAVATGKTITILDAPTGQVLQVIDASGSSISDICWIPQTHLLLVGTDTGRNRIWGQPVEGEKFGMSPLTPRKVGTDIKTNLPATLAENLAVMDVRLLPQLPDAKPQPLERFDSVTCQVPVGIAEAQAFYSYILGERGWKVTTDPMTQDSIPFTKNGFSLEVSPFGEKPTEAFVSISLSGNFDLRQAPKLNQFPTEMTQSTFRSVQYTIKANLLQIETELLKHFHQAGWTAVVSLIDVQQEGPDERDLMFVKNGTSVRVSVARNKVDRALYDVNYNQSPVMHSLPVPPDAGLIEWADFFDVQMVANTSLSLQEATAFYEDAMPQHGWTPREIGRRIDKDVVYLPYFWGQRDVTIALNPIGSGLVRIRVGRYSDSSFQKPEDEIAVDSKTNEPEVPRVSGLEAADLPILHAVGAASYEASRDGKIRFDLDKISLVELAQEYKAALQALGWTAEDFTEPTAESVGINFTKDEKIIYYRSDIDPRGKGYVYFSGKGLLWTKAIPSKQLISYSTWLRNNKFPASLKQLGEYQAEMEKLLAAAQER